MPVPEGLWLRRVWAPAASALALSSVVAVPNPTLQHAAAGHLSACCSGQLNPQVRGRAGVDSNSSVAKPSCYGRTPVDLDVAAGNG